MPFIARRFLAGLRAAATVAPVLAGSAAHADFRLCNQTPSRVGVALGYYNGTTWITEGWWNLKPNACETVLKGKLSQQFYYIHAVDYDRGGEWGGRVRMCTRDREFVVQGNQNCLVRGYDFAGFFEVDTGQQESWTVELRESGQTVPAARPGR